MVDRSPPAGAIVAAVGFDDQTDLVVETALSMASLSGAHVVFVNALEPAYYDAIAVESPGFSVLPALLQANEEERLRDREKMMAGLVERARRDYTTAAPIVGRVRRGDVLRMLINEAISVRAKLIITACHPSAYRLLPEGFSTALSLMHHAPMPILVVGATPVRFDRPGVRLMIADDLQESTREAVRKAYQLAMALEDPLVKHMHVHGDFRELLRDAWVDLIQRIPGLRMLDQTPDSLWSDEFEARMTALRQQGRPFSQAAEQHGAHIDFDVRTGDLGTEMRAVTEAFAPDLLVFGRHKLLRTRPFLIGRMPFKAMLQERRAVLLVPPTGDLYARLPIP